MTFSTCMQKDFSLSWVFFSCRSGEIILTGSEDATARAFNLKGGDAAAAGASGSGSSAAAAAAAP